MASTTQKKLIKQVTCTVCARQMQSNNLKRHMRTHEENWMIRCSMCSEHFTDEEALNKHGIDVHYEAKKIFNEENTLIREMKEKASHGLQDITRDTLSYMFEPPKHVCTICQRPFYTLKSLKKHEVLHNRVKNLKCIYCAKPFKSPTNRRLHMNRCSKNPEKLVTEQVQDGGGAVKNTYDDGNLEIVESALDGKTARYSLGFNNSHEDLLYRLQHALDSQVHDLLIKISNAESWKYYISLSLVFRKASDIGAVTDPPAVFNSEVLLLTPAENMQRQLGIVYQNIIHQIDSFQERGSGWVIDHLVRLDVNTTNYSLREDDEE